MANALFGKAKEQFLQAGINMSSGTVKAALVDTGTVAFNSAFDYYDDISAGVVGTPVEITDKTFTNGVFKSSSTTTWTAVSGATVEAIVIYVDTGDAATSPLIAWIDTGQTGLPVTPNSGNIVMTWDSGAYGIFAL